MNKEFGIRLRKARKAKGLTMLQFCFKAELEPVMLSRYENGRGNPHLETAVRIAKTLDVSLDHLVGLK